MSFRRVVLKKPSRSLEILPHFYVDSLPLTCVTSTTMNFPPVDDNSPLSNILSDIVNIKVILCYNAGVSGNGAVIKF